MDTPNKAEGSSDPSGDRDRVPNCSANSPRTSANPPPGANDDAVLSAVSRTIRSICLDESFTSKLPKGVAANDDGQPHHPDARAVMSELLRNGSLEGCADSAIKAAYESSHDN